MNVHTNALKTVIFGVLNLSLRTIEAYDVSNTVRNKHPTLKTET